MTKRLLLPTLFAIVLLVTAYGCSSPESATPAASSATEDAHAGHSDQEMPKEVEHADAHAGHNHAANESDAHDQKPDKGKTDMEKMTETLASFSPEDRASAMKQHFCPVSGAMLGTMGAPEKVDVNGQPVWICCDGCKDKLLADPAKYLAKITK